jgi:hypothetical protein
MLRIFCPALPSKYVAPANKYCMFVTLEMSQPLMSPSSRALQIMRKTSRDETISTQETRVLEGL